MTNNANHQAIKLSEQQVDRFRKRAKKDGKIDSPGSENNPAWENSLHQIANLVAEQVRDRFNGFKENCELMHETITGMFHDLPNRSALQPVEATANQRRTEAGPMLESLREDAALMAKFHKRFPNLDDSVVKPHNPNPILFFGLSIALIAIESLANSRLFAEADNFGIVGGAMLAFLVSIGNVLPMILLSFLAKTWRGNLDMPIWVWRLICCASIGLAIIYNIGVVALRNYLIEGNGGEPNPFEGWVLFVIGNVIAGVAFWDGWNFADTYAKFRECMERINKITSNYSMRILSPIEDEIQNAEKTMKNLPKHITRLNHNIGRWDTNTPLLVRDAVSEVERVWREYHGIYCPIHRDPDPELTTLTPENAKEWGIHIHDEWFEFVRKIRESIRDNENKLEEQNDEIRQSFEALIKLKSNFSDVINADIENAMET